MNWKSVMVFYVKTTSWIIIPLVLAVILGQYVSNQTLFFSIIFIGFLITCYGIYKEIKEYKKQLEQNDKNGNK